VNGWAWLFFAAAAVVVVVVKKKTEVVADSDVIGSEVGSVSL